MLTAFLAERDAPCPRCGSNLRSLTLSTRPTADRLNLAGQAINRDAP